MKILIDTNIYLDFYRSGNDSLKILSSIREFAEVIILTDQIIDEFYRSRVKVIREVRKQFEDNTKISGINNSFLNACPSYRTFVEASKQFREAQKSLLADVNAIFNDITQDPIAYEFSFLKRSKENHKPPSILYTNDEIINRGGRRKLFGNPPTTSDKYSIGDELNWELVLEYIKEDIVIVGRDRTYNDNFDFLRSEFHSKTGRYIVALYETISEAFKHLGLPSEELEEIEKRQIADMQNLRPHKSVRE